MRWILESSILIVMHDSPSVTHLWVGKREFQGKSWRFQIVFASHLTHQAFPNTPAKRQICSLVTMATKQVDGSGAIWSPPDELLLHNTHDFYRNDVSASSPTMATKRIKSRTERSDAVLSLPDELLLKIADCIDGDGASLSLRQLALAHRRFRPIAHETLIRNGVVSVNRISDYIVALSQHCKWNGRIEKVTNTECGFEAVAGLARRRAIKAADKFLRQTWPDIPEGDKSTLLQAERKAPIWTQLLFVVLGDLKELSFVSMDKVWCVIYMEDVLNAVLFYDDFANIIPRLNRLIRGKLQTLSAVVLELDNQDLGHTRLPCSAICVKFRSPSAFRVDPLPAISSSTIIPSTKVSAVSAPIGN